MLKAHHQAALVAAACSAALGLAGVTAAFAAEKAPPKKRWEKLSAEPIDYAPFDRRRAENAKTGTSPLNDVMARGFAKLDELGATRIIDDAPLNNGLSVEMRRLLSERLGLKAPPIEIILVDDLGAYDDALAAGQDSEVLKAVLAKRATNFTVASTGGGAIVLGLSVLKLIKSYDEFDFLVAHEMSHILYDHFTEDERRQRISKLIGVAIVIAALVTRRSDANTREAVGWSSLGLVVANGFLGPAWERGQEKEADQLGFELILEGGRSPAGARNVLEWYQKRNEAHEGYLDLICGPDSAGERILKGLFKGIFGIPIPEKGHDPGSPLCKERQNIFAAILDDHPDPKDRLEDLEAYLPKFYPQIASGGDVPQTMFGDKSLIETLSPGGEMSVLGYAHDGIEAYHHGNFDAVKRLASAIPERGPAEQRLPVLELKFYAANLDGKRPQALQYLEQATKVPELSRRISDLAESEYVRDGRYEDAVRIVRRRGQRGLAQPIEVLPRVITLLRMANKQTEIAAVIAECTALDRPDVLSACEAAAQPPQAAP